MIVQWNTVMAGIAGLMAAASVTAAEPASHCPGPGVHLQVLGSGGNEVTSERAASGYLLWVDGHARVLIDAGSGTWLRMRASGAALADLDVVLLTRLNAAETADFPVVVEAALRDGRIRVLPVYGPSASRRGASTVVFVRALVDGVRGAYQQLGTVLNPLGRDGFKVRPHDVRPLARRIGRPTTNDAAIDVWRNDKLRIRATVSKAPDTGNAVTWRIDAANKSVVIVGDVNLDPSVLEQFARQADLGVASAAARGPRTAPEAIAKSVAVAQIKQLVLAHRTPATHGREADILALIRKNYAGTVHFADDLGCFAP